MVLPKQTLPPSTWVLTGRSPLVLAPLTISSAPGWVRVLWAALRGQAGDEDGVMLWAQVVSWPGFWRQPHGHGQGTGLGPLPLHQPGSGRESPTPWHRPWAPGCCLGGCVVFKPQNVEETCFSVTRTRL